ncbi:MAG TPA: hypothetical protein VIW69_16505 [Candidatus Elarobacter sp.]
MNHAVLLAFGGLVAGLGAQDAASCARPNVPAAVIPIDVITGVGVVSRRPTSRPSARHRHQRRQRAGLAQAVAT